eukprot:1643454-Prymnesium_polylepis.1
MSRSATARPRTRYPDDPMPQADDGLLCTEASLFVPQHEPCNVQGAGDAESAASGKVATT